MSETRPLPIPDLDSAVYWEAAHRREFLLQRCVSCERFRFYPRSICPYCFSEGFEWKSLSGQGTVYSYTVIHKPPSPAFRDKVPYILALIDLAEGVRMMSNILESEPNSVEIGMPVEIVFENVTHNITLPQFRPLQPQKGS